MWHQRGIGSSGGLAAAHLSEVVASGADSHAADGSRSTLWLGSEGAGTPAHYDAYGVNFVAQCAGAKRWRLSPPPGCERERGGDAAWPLRPTRVPYEESSVFARSDDSGRSSCPQLSCPSSRRSMRNWST